MVSKKDDKNLKPVAVGHDGSKEAKKAYLEKEAIDMQHKGNYAEISGKLADIVISKGANVVEDENIVKDVLHKNIKWFGKNPEDSNALGNGWYSRNIAGEEHLKIMIGKPIV